MKKWIAMFLSVVMLAGILAGCKKPVTPEEELAEEFSPDDKMTIAICALARSVNAQKAAAKPVRYAVKSVRRLDGVKMQESVSNYDNEKLFAAEEVRYFDGQTQTGSESVCTYVEQDGSTYRIIAARAVTQGETTEKTYRVLHTADSQQAIQTAWTAGGYGADMAYQTYGRFEDLIVSAALTQGGAEAQITSASDYVLTITNRYKTETYTVEKDFITQFVWTEMTTEGESEQTWDYFWNIAEVTLPDLAEYTLVTE